MKDHSTTIENDFWQLEINYWNTIKNGNIINYRNLLHEEFSDWPSITDKPLRNIKSMLDFLEKTKSGFISLDFEINEMYTSVIDKNEAIIYFTCKILAELNDRTTVSSDYRMIHIWRKENNKYKLVGGLQSKICDDK